MANPSPLEKRLKISPRPVGIGLTINQAKFTPSINRREVGKVSPSPFQHLREKGNQKHVMVLRKVGLRRIFPRASRQPKTFASS